MTIEVPGDIASEGVGLGVGGDVGKGAFAVDGLWMGWGELAPNPQLPAEIAALTCGERKKAPSHLLNREQSAEKSAEESAEKSTAPEKSRGPLLNR